MKGLVNDEFDQAKKKMMDLRTPQSGFWILSWSILFSLCPFCPCLFLFSKLALHHSIKVYLLFWVSETDLHTYDQ